MREELKKRRIGTGVHYIALHLHPFYQRQYGYRAGQFPNAEYLSDRTFSVPLSPRVTEADARDVVRTLFGTCSGERVRRRRESNCRGTCRRTLRRRLRIMEPATWRAISRPPSRTCCGRPYMS